MAGFLIGELAFVADQRGIRSLWANVLRDNRAMAGLFQAVGGVESAGEDDDERTFRMPVDSILKSRPAFLKSKHIQRIER
jgi:hypothetical protein